MALGQNQDLDRGINDLDDVVGKKIPSRKLKMWPRRGPPTQIEVPADGFSAGARLINDDRLVAGPYYVDGSTACYPWTPEGGPLRMGAMLQCEPRGITADGQIAGMADNDPFLYKGGQMTDLGPLPGAQYAVGWALNRSGHVVGYGTFYEGAARRSSGTARRT